MLLSQPPRPPPSNMTGRHSPLTQPSVILGPPGDTAVALGMGATAVLHPPGLQGAGTGKRATTILADQGDIVTVITDVPYVVRSRHEVAGPARKGARPMHRTTLTIKTQPQSEYNTTVNTYHSGQQSSAPPPPRPVPFPSQHLSQIKLGRGQDSAQFDTNYQHHYPLKDITPAHQLHYPSQVNKLNMNQGGEMKTVIDKPHASNAPNQYRYWSQYNRIHNKLGVMMGPGVSRERVIRSSYNPVTGTHQGSAWKDQNRRVSGNRVLYGQRKDGDRCFTLG